MSHHETKNTTGILAWCNTCGRRTMHRVTDRRKGHCTEHAPAGLSKAQEKRRREQEKKERELKLF